MKFAAIAVLVLASAPALGAPPVTPIKSGTYHCIAGGTRMMLTLGDVRISGNRYVFTDPNGHMTSGTYAVTPMGYRWSGDFGGIKNAQIVESKPDGVPGYFWLSYKVTPSSPATSLSCKPQ